MRHRSNQIVAGFSLLEMMLAMLVTLILLSVAVSMFRDASQANQAVVLGSDMSDNLRAGLNMIQLDLQQAGAGIPIGGIPIPFTAPCGTTAAINRPKLGGTTTFPYPGATCESVIPAVEPGNMMGPAITAPDATAGTPTNPNSITDEITVVYQDNTSGLTGTSLQSVPVNQPSSPGPPAVAGCPNGKITYSGTTLTVTFDSNCVNLSSPGSNEVFVNPGDLIMFSNTLGTALLAVTTVSGQTLTFAKGDAFDLNGRTDPSGTILQLETGGASCGGGAACWPVTTATRVWMITYYLDNVTAPPDTRLIRQVNLNPPTVVGETLENLQFTYNFVDNNTNPANQATVPAGDSEAEIRSVNVLLGARSSHGVQRGSQTVYARSNLWTQVSLRSLAYTNRY